MMDETLAKRLGKLERESKLWRGLALVLLVVGVASFGLRPIVAQQPRTTKGAMEYRVSRCLWTQMGSVLNEWEGKGYEAFQIVPLQTDIGVGGTMQVAVVFRKPAK